jgi:Pyruvate/2-oxoacid:ferredoxin oxidoreductase delta subunit
MKRQIVRIDEEKCNGCGACLPACAEGALQIVNGKARLVADRLCDGLGACLGVCPQGALLIEEREAADFDEAAVHAHLHPHQPEQAGEQPYGCGCPGTHARVLAGKSTPAGLPGSASEPSALGQWPVQLKLLNPAAPFLREADLLIAADCVPFAYATFHRDLLRGRVLAVGCPKLDDAQAYVEKLAQIIERSRPRSITVAYMEVPCCGGLVSIVREAARRSGCSLPVETVKVALDGSVAEKQQMS